VTAGSGASMPRVFFVNDDVAMLRKLRVERSGRAVKAAVAN